MRLTLSQQKIIKKVLADILGETYQVKLFGSRVIDSERGGDVDLLVEIEKEVQNPALLAAKISARIMRALNGRKVDVVLSAPNLQKHNIHYFADKNGVLL